MRSGILAIGACVVGLMSLSSAYAMSPSAGHASAGIATAQSGGITLVDRRDDMKGMHRKHFRPGGRYKHAPKGWHRYDRRPGDWRNRGCVVVGPIWWCP